MIDKERKSETPTEDLVDVTHEHVGEATRQMMRDIEAQPLCTRSKIQMFATSNLHEITCSLGMTSFHFTQVRSIGFLGTPYLRLHYRAREC